MLNIESNPIIEGEIKPTFIVERDGYNVGKCIITFTCKMHMEKFRSHSALNFVFDGSITLEAIETGDPEVLGLAIKRWYQRFKEEIDNYQYSNNANPPTT